MPSPFQRDRVVAALSKSWSLATSGGWAADNPTRGQCNATALLLEELFGGEILKTPLPEGDHFYNRINGQRLDLTDSQFEAPITYADLLSNRQEALSGTTSAKYEALKGAFRAACGATDNGEEA
jgi:hypothetical protein